MSRPGTEPAPPRWEASTLEKSYSNSFLIVSNIYQWRMLATVSFPFVYNCLFLKVLCTVNTDLLGNLLFWYISHDICVVWSGGRVEPADLAAQQDWHLQHNSGHQAQAVGREPAPHQVCWGQHSFHLCFLTFNTCHGKPEFWFGYKQRTFVKFCCQQYLNKPCQ